MFSFLWRCVSFAIVTSLKITIALTRSIHLTVLNICDIIEDGFELNIKKLELQGASLDGPNSNPKQIDAKIINFSDMANILSQMNQTDNVSMSSNEKNPNTDVIICNLDTSKKVIITHRDLNSNISKEKLDQSESSRVEVKCKNVKKAKVSNLPSAANGYENVHSGIYSTYCLCGSLSGNSNMSIENDVSNSEIVLYPQNSTFLRTDSDINSKKPDCATDENGELNSTQNKQPLDCKNSEVKKNTSIADNHNFNTGLCAGAKISSSNLQGNAEDSDISLSDVFVESQISNAVEFMRSLRDLVEKFDNIEYKLNEMFNDSSEIINLSNSKSNEIENSKESNTSEIIREREDEKRISCAQKMLQSAEKLHLSCNEHFQAQISPTNQENCCAENKNDNISTCNSDESLSSEEERHKLNSTLLGELTFLNDSIKQRLSTSGFSTANEAALNFKKIQNEIKGTLAKTPGLKKEIKEIQYPFPPEMHLIDRPYEDFKEMLSCSSYESLPVSDHIRNALDKSQICSMYRENCESSSTPDFSSVDDLVEAFQKIKSTISVSELFERRSSATFSLAGNSKSEINKLDRAQSCEFIRTEKAENRKIFDNESRNKTKSELYKFANNNIAKNQSLAPLAIKTDYTNIHELRSPLSPMIDLLLEKDQLSTLGASNGNKELILAEDSSNKLKSCLTPEDLNHSKNTKSEISTIQNSTENKLRMCFQAEDILQFLFDNKSANGTELKDENLDENNSSDCARKEKRSRKENKSPMQSKKVKTENSKNRVVVEPNSTSKSLNSSFTEFYQRDENYSPLNSSKQTLLNINDIAKENSEEHPTVKSNPLLISFHDNTSSSDSSSDHSASTIREL